MADDDAESIGGISVSIGASHAKLVSDLAQADRLLEAWAKRQVNIAIGATFAGGTSGGGAGASAAPKVRYGAAATTGIQAQQGQSSLQAAINAQLAKTGEHYDAVTGEVTKATSAIRGQRTAIIGVQEAAARPTALNIDTAALQNDLNAVLGTLREIVTTAQSIGSLPAARIGVGGAGAVSGGSVTTHERASNTDLATRIGRAVSTNRRAAGAGLGALSAEAEAANGGARTSATFLPPLSQAGQAALVARGSLPPSGQRGSTFATSGAIPIADDNELGGAGRLRAVNEADIERRAQAQVARATAQAVSAARTSRTQASGLGGIFGGGVTRERIQATAALGEAEQKLTIAHRRVADFEQKGVTTGRAYAAAREEQTVAENEYGSALGRVEKLASPLSGARNLLAITAAGAAFSLGLKAVDFGLAVTEKAFSNVFDIATGFGAETTKVTGALAAQTAALHGNSAEAVANAEAQAGISTAAAQNLNPQLQLTTQVKAGAQAATSQQDLIRAALGAGGAPQGLLGGYGGVLNGPFLAQQLGGGKGFAETIKDTFGDIGTKTQQVLEQSNPHFGGRGGAYGPPAPAPQTALDQVAALGKDRVALETSLNDAAKRGATALGVTSEAVVHFGAVAKDTTALRALPQELQDLAKNSGEALYDANGRLVTAADAATKALEQVAVGQGIAPADQIGRANLAAEQERQRESAASLPAIRSQQAFQLPSQIAAIGRQLGLGTQTQLPVQQALAGLANPNVPVGTGIAPANAAEASRVAGSLKEAQGLQDQLNAKYAQGQQIIERTYDPAILSNFGQAAKTDFDQALATVVSTGKEIASIQAGITNEQAAYQTHQYNFQLVIAKRNLSDIGGLINQNLGAGESYYGQLERQNLLLGRQSQLLQFELSQRQINFQTAVAGFQAPGLTDEERQARIEEAKIEASYAQKQLDLQKQQYRNQIKLIDIGNLRQGRDLLHQIGLLQEGRQVTIDTAGAEAKLLRLNQLQQQEVAKVGQYLAAVDNVTSVALGNIQQLEAAAGKAMANIATDVLGQFGIFINGLDSYVASIGGGGSAGISGGKNSTVPKATATGGVFGLNQPTRIGSDRIAGEAGNETLIVLAHPRSAGISGGGGAGSLTINFNAPIGVRSNDDIRSIARAVEDIFNAKAARLGLRSLSSATS